jgi:hypothetical protein
MITSATATATEIHTKTVGKGKKQRLEEELCDHPFYFEEFYSLDSHNDIARAIERINDSVDEVEYNNRKVVMRIEVVIQNGGN